MKAANNALAEIKNAVTVVEDKVIALEAKVDGNFDALRAELRANSSALETKLIKWIVGTMLAGIGTIISCTGVALAIAKAIP